MVYFVLALWLFRGRNCGYGQVMAKLADGLYHQRRGADLLAGQLDPGGWVDAGGGSPGGSDNTRFPPWGNFVPLSARMGRVARAC
jgi:hypothetical protein